MNPITEQLFISRLPILKKKQQFQYYIKLKHSSIVKAAYIDEYKSPFSPSIKTIGM